MHASPEPPGNPPSWITAPSLDGFPAERTARASVELRYEDIAEDGRIKAECLPHAMGVVCWRKLVGELPATAILRREAILPILSRLVIVGGGGPLSVRDSVDAHGAYDVRQAVDEVGRRDKLVLNLQATIFGVRGRTHGPPPDGAGETMEIGRVFAEHVFTRPFAPPESRKVATLPAGVHDGPLEEYAWPSNESLLRVPTGASPIDGDALPAALTHTFGLRHTDSNQHVNSLVYPSLLEEAVLRRLADVGRSTRVLMTAVELRYRKPCFVGDAVRWHLALHAEGPRVLATATLLPADAAAGNPAEKPYCYARATFE
ncbi:MAG: hypothetical protein R3A78_10585 [Polyangiales bacterium]